MKLVVCWGAGKEKLALAMCKHRDVVLVLWHPLLGDSRRGGAFNNDNQNARGANRNNNNPNNRNNNTGFRVAEPLSQVVRKCGASKQASPRFERCTLMLPVLPQTGGALVA